MTFLERYAVSLTAGPPLSLQVVFPAAWDFPPDALDEAVRGYHPDLAEAVTELHAALDWPAVAGLVAGKGPQLTAAGLVAWGAHVVKLAAFNAPMPYGPIASCVAPALMPPEVKHDAAAHRSHVLLYHAGPEADPYERYLALAAVAGSLARLGATAILNEEARTACPAFDLVPDAGEDALLTLRKLPLTYLFIGFVRVDLGDGERPWIRTFGAHLFGLPDLAYQPRSAAENREVFAWFAATYGYLRETAASLNPGQILALDDDTQFRLRAPAVPATDLFHSEGELVIFERVPALPLGG